MKIYTKTGDSGETSLVGGVRICKDSAQLETYGTIDELNSVTGVALELLRALALSGDKGAERDLMTQLLRDVQNQLFTVGSILATEADSWERYWGPTDLAAWTEEMEAQIDTYSGQLPEWRGFILPSGTLAAAQLHVCRTICRRAERALCHFAQESELKGPVFDHVLKYTNRLSDFYFILARKAIQIEEKEETIWKSTK
ncbi:MAG: cob(I)yrinic acid a,c-diamide adenosyltransferase [Bacteroidales bacterium]|nr:cob(I)yrinic acid a,c-diamide adenosyltransferase [Bacteroidales bacterium]